MVSLQPWSITDIWHYGRVNIDPFTETYSIPFYLFYTMQWPQLAWTARNNSGAIVGYILGQAKTDRPDECKGHVTAVSVCEDYRRLGIATTLMGLLERVSDRFFHAHFVDLYVRPTNTQAQAMYTKMGYVCYRRILDYYETLHEDGLDWRKSLSRDPEKKFMRPLPAPVTKEEAAQSD
jgi:N-terminal acetyltransferase B complex catalytic subunit